MIAEVDVWHGRFAARSAVIESALTPYEANSHGLLASSDLACACFLILWKCGQLELTREELDHNDHDTDSIDCWCGPRFFKPCFICLGDGCVACSVTDFPGMTELSREDAESDDASILILHREVERCDSPAKS